MTTGSGLAPDQEFRAFIDGAGDAVKRLIADKQGEFKAFTDAGADAIGKMIADVKREADRAEQLRLAEFRAWFAERKVEVLESGLGDPK